MRFRRGPKKIQKIGTKKMKIAKKSKNDGSAQDFFEQFEQGWQFKQGCAKKKQCPASPFIAREV